VTETVPSGMMRRQKSDRNHSPPKNKLVQDSERNEENGYQDPASNKTKINYTKKPNGAHKNILKEKILQVINENFIEMLLDTVNHNIQEASRSSNTAKIKNMRKQKIK
jgi:hypothetical protein